MPVVANDLHPLAEAFLGSLTVRPSTVDDYRGDLRSFNRWCEQQGIQVPSASEDDLARYVHHLTERKLSSATRGRRAGVLKQFFQWLLDQGRIPSNPARKISSAFVRGEPTEVLSVRELRAVLVASEGDPVSRSVVGLLAVMGLGVQDVEAASVTDLRDGPTGSQLRLRARSEATVPMPPLVREAVRQAVGRRQQGALLINQRGNRMDRAVMTRITAKLGEAAQLDLKLSPSILTHTMRHLALTHGLPLVALVQALPGAQLKNLILTAATAAPAEYPASYRLAALVRPDPDSTQAYLDQADLMSGIPDVHPAARVMFAGAALEQHLRLLAQQAGALTRDSERGTLTGFASLLRGRRSLTPQEVQLVAVIAGHRDNASHGWFAEITDAIAHWTLAHVRVLVDDHPLAMA